jgi:hypothetical protein
MPFRYSRIRRAAVLPSPAALTTCLVLVSRTSPACKYNGRYDSLAVILFNNELFTFRIRFNIDPIVGNLVFA